MKLGPMSGFSGAGGEGSELKIWWFVFRKKIDNFNAVKYGEQNERKRKQRD